ncbi:hypothetical protein GCM10019017_17940 [Streptomyces showdoensis]
MGGGTPRPPPAPHPGRPAPARPHTLPVPPASHLQATRRTRPDRPIRRIQHIRHIRPIPPARPTHRAVPRGRPSPLPRAPLARSGAPPHAPGIRPHARAPPGRGPANLSAPPSPRAAPPPSPLPPPRGDKGFPRIEFTSAFPTVCRTGGFLPSPYLSGA